ncbi:MAG: hypothetical protein IPO80_10080 [Propionibacteriaceae bacterium]|nr:hypothetical protein [Propionibacteriaceae bacterium]
MTATRHPSNPGTQRRINPAVDEYQRQRNTRDGPADALRNSAELRGVAPGRAAVANPMGKTPSLTQSSGGK